MSEPTIEDLQTERDQLRARLEQEVTELRGSVSGGLSNEDVRRIEHPEEFAPAAAAEPSKPIDDEPVDDEARPTIVEQLPTGAASTTQGTSEPVQEDAERRLLAKLEDEARSLRAKLFGGNVQ